MPLRVRAKPLRAPGHAALLPSRCPPPQHAGTHGALGRSVYPPSTHRPQDLCSSFPSFGDALLSDPCHSRSAQEAAAPRRTLLKSPSRLPKRLHLPPPGGAVCFVRPWSLSSNCLRSSLSSQHRGHKITPQLTPVSARPAAARVRPPRTHHSPSRRPHWLLPSHVAVAQVKVNEGGCERRSGRRQFRFPVRGCEVSRSTWTPAA